MPELGKDLWPARSPGLPVAFVTMARDEKLMIEAWVHNGLRICSEAAFYIIDHGSNPPLSEVFGSQASFETVNISYLTLPGVDFDDDFKAMALSSLANTLLHCYEVVVATDCDELLVGFGLLPEEILPKLRQLSGVTAPIGFELVQNTSVESAFIPTIDVEKQRAFGFFSSWYTKPVIWKQRSEFGPGLHRSRDNFQYEHSLGLLHLRSVDRELSYLRAAQRREFKLSETQVSRGRGKNWLVPDNEKEDLFAELLSAKAISSFGSVLGNFEADLAAAHDKNLAGFWGHNISRKSIFCEIEGVLYSKNQSDGAARS